MKQEEELELLGITHKMLLALESPGLVMTEEKRESLESMNESMGFFIEQGNFDRALKEARGFLKRLEQI
jgi:hypothetical protein